jgi:hypothetical protein
MILAEGFLDGFFQLMRFAILLRRAWASLAVQKLKN